MQRSGRLALMFLLGVAAGCYKPNIVSGGFLCTEGGVCPDGFRCLDNRCYAGDAGPEAPVCVDASPTLFSVCNDPPPAGSDCNPACQTGCGCLRCTVSGSKAVCTNAGGKAAGEVCNLTGDDCGVGLGCVKDVCGTSLGRCRQFCRSGADCTGGCNTLVGAISVCEPPTQACNPVAGTGCPDPALACYPTSSFTSTICDCPGSAAVGSSCTFPSDCAPHLTCIQFNTNPPTSSCRTVCTSSADCATGEACSKNSGTATYGFCLAP